MTNLRPMRFVVYHVQSTMVREYFYQQSAAAKLVAKLNAAQNEYDRTHIGGYAYTTIENYKTNVVHMVTRKNLMSGEEYQEPSNTPSYCSPASEAYWSM